MGPEKRKVVIYDCILQKELELKIFMATVNTFLMQMQEQTKSFSMQMEKHLLLPLQTIIFVHQEVYFKAIIP